MLVIECSIGQALGPYEAVQCHPTFPLALAPLSLSLSSLAFRSSPLDEPVLTYQLLPVRIPPGVCGPTTLLFQPFVLLQHR